MRKIYLIKNDIDQTASRIGSLKEELEDARYVRRSHNVFAFILPLLLSIAVLVFYFGAAPLFDKVGYGFFLILFLVFLLVYRLVSIIKTFRRNLTLPEVRGLFIFWLILLAVSAASLYLFSQHMLEERPDGWDETWRFDLSVYINLTTFPALFDDPAVTVKVLRYWVCSSALIAVPSLILSISLFARLFMEHGRKRRCEENVSSLTAQLEDAERAFLALQNERNRNVQEAEQLYRAEIAKEAPDEATIRWAAECGCEEAIQKAVPGMAKAFLKEMGALTESERLSKAKEIKALLDCVETKHDGKLEILTIWARAYAQAGDSYLPKAELDKLESLKEEAKRFNSDRSDTVRTFAEDAYTRLCYVISSIEEHNRRVDEILHPPCYDCDDSDNSSLYYAGGRPLTDDELHDLNESICSGLWNYRAIESVTYLSRTQKEQLHEYNKIHGD